jgi:hypothetical protein
MMKRDECRWSEWIAGSITLREQHNAVIPEAAEQRSGIRTNAKKVRDG